MFSKVYSQRKVFHNGHLENLQQTDKIINNNEVVFMKNRKVINGNKMEVTYKNPKYFRKTQKHVHFIDNNHMLESNTIRKQGMPVLPLDSYVLYKRKHPVKSKKHRKKNRKNKKNSKTNKHKK